MGLACLFNRSSELVRENLAQVVGVNLDARECIHSDYERHILQLRSSPAPYGTL